MADSVAAKLGAMDGGSSHEIISKPPAAGAIEIRVYRMRWVQLALFGSLTFISAVLWVTFAPISTLSANFYDVSTSQINWLSLIFMTLYLPGTLVSSYCTNRFGVHRALVAAAVLQAAGAMLRYASIFVSTDSSSAYSVLMLGQAMAAIAQPAFVNAPVAIADTWFAVSERDLCTVVGAMSNPLGIAIGQLLPTFIVPADVAESDLKSAFGTLLLSEAIVAAAIMCVSLALLKERPPLPPSHAAAERVSRVGSKTTFRASILAFWTESRDMLFRNNEMAKLFVGFGFGLGIFNAVTTLVEQLVIPAGYDSDDAGIFAGAMVVIGILAAGVAGVIMDKTHKYRLCLRVGTGGAFVAIILWLGMISPDNFVGLTITFALVGAALLPLLPIALENAVECTYPIPEEGSTSLMMLGGQYLGIVFILSLQALMDSETTFERVYPPSSILVACVLFGACVLLFWFDGPMLRTKAENEHGGQSSPNGPYDELASASKIAVNNIVHESSSSDLNEKSGKDHADSSSDNDNDNVIVEHEESSNSDVVLSRREESTSSKRAHV